MNPSRNTAILHLNFQRDLVPLNGAGFDIELFFLVGAGRSCDLATVLFEVQDGGICLGFAIGAGNVEAAGPFASHVGQQADYGKKKTADGSFHGYAYAVGSREVPSFAQAGREFQYN